MIELTDQQKQQRLADKSKEFTLDLNQIQAKHRMKIVAIMDFDPFKGVYPKLTLIEDVPNNNGLTQDSPA